jgi:ATP-dependent RNA helicase DeaD
VITDHEDVEDAGMDELRLAVGRRDGLRAGDVLRLLADAIKTAKRDVGRIHLRDRFTVVNLRADLVASAIDALREAQWNDRPLAPERGRGGAAPVPGSTEATE